MPPGGKLMIVGLVYRLFTILLIALTCFYLQELEQEASAFAQQFRDDHRARVCGHFLAFEANARAARAYVQRRLQLDEERLEVEIEQWIDEQRPHLDCADDQSRLLQQRNEVLSRDYPNFWFR
jgi:hypothetical protein